MSTGFQKYLKFLGLSACIASISCLSSCNYIFENLEECQKRVALRFVFEYNMEFANSFPSQSHCLTLLVYNADGSWVNTFVETGEVLADENYRMTLDLEPGNYHCIAYGGLACEEKSFTHMLDPQSTDYRDLLVKLDRTLVESDIPVKRRLHDFFYGSVDFTIEKRSSQYVEYKVEMMKNTNAIRVMLQHIDGSPVDVDDFTFEITDDNTAFGHDNDVIADGGVKYTPWSKGQQTVGEDANGNFGVTVAYAELSTSRLMKRNNIALTIKKTQQAMARDDASADDIVAQLPLQDYLPLLKSDYFDTMNDQEFLDRQSVFPLYFFLDKNDKWVYVTISVGDWTVRINNESYNPDGNR